MLFIHPSEVDAVWRVVARHTALNDLGIAAKVACGDPTAPADTLRLICVYTKDFSNMEDVYRVALKMKKLGLITTTERPIYYKCGQFDSLACSFVTNEIRRIYIPGPQVG
jgi:hypothetical protein